MAALPSSATEHSSAAALLRALPCVEAAPLRSASMLRHDGRAAGLLLAQALPPLSVTEWRPLLAVLRHSDCRAQRTIACCGWTSRKLVRREMEGC